MPCTSTRLGFQVNFNILSMLLTGESLSKHTQKLGYKLGKTIGSGSYCKVKEVYSLRNEAKLNKLACKIVNKTKSSVKYVTKFLPREIENLKLITHDNIVKIHHIYENKYFTYIIMDLCPMGDLLEYVKFNGPLTEGVTRSFFKQILSAVNYIHSQEICHRDLKCENILLDSMATVKLTDFGFSRQCCSAAGQRLLCDTFCGSPAYAAPEVLQGLPYNPKLYDVWSLGCVLFIMLTCEMPFDDSNMTQLIRKQKSRHFSFPAHLGKQLSVGAKSLVRQMLEPDVTRRLPIRLIAHQMWMQEEETLPSVESKIEGKQ